MSSAGVWIWVRLFTTGGGARQQGTMFNARANWRALRLFREMAGRVLGLPLTHAQRR